MEGVLTPEIWIAVSEKTGIPELRRTTRDEPDYDKLMKYRLNILDQHGLKLSDLQRVIGALRPLDGALDFLRELRATSQVVILSDTFEEFARPLLRQLEWPTLLCHRLEVVNDRIVNYRLRIADQKKQADGDILFRAPDNVRKEFPQFKAVEAYPDLLELIKEAF